MANVVSYEGEEKCQLGVRHSMVERILIPKDKMSKSRFQFEHHHLGVSGCCSNGLIRKSINKIDRHSRHKDSRSTVLFSGSESFFSTLFSCTFSDSRNEKEPYTIMANLVWPESVTCDSYW